MVLLYWLIFAIILYFAWVNCKQTIIVWMPLQLLFNDMIALKYTSPILTLSIAVNFTLPIIFFCKYILPNKKNELTNEPFFFKKVFILYLISYTLSIIFSIAPFAAIINTTLKFFVKNFLMVYLFQLCLKDKKDLYLFLKAVVIVGILISGLGLLESVIQDNPIQNFIHYSAPNAGSDAYRDRVYYIPPAIRGTMAMRYGMVRAYSFFGIPIAFGIACIFLGFFLFLFIRTKKYVFKPYIMWGTLLLLISGVFTANSKTGMIGLFIILFCFFKPKQIFNFKIILPILTIITIVAIYFPGYINNYLSLFDADIATEGGGSSIKGRQMQFEIAMRLFNLNPLFGNGCGSISILKVTQNASDIMGAESSWMQILPERGIFGAIVYIYWYIYVFKKLSITVPKRITLYLLLSILIMETATGMLDMALYCTIIIATRKFFQLYKKDKRKQIIIQKHSELAT